MGLEEHDHLFLGELLNCKLEFWVILTPKSIALILFIELYKCK